MSSKKMGRPETDTAPVTIRMEREMIRQIDDYRRTIDDLPTRPEVIRRVMEAFLAKELGKSPTEG